MPRTGVVTDSTAYLPAGVQDRYGVEVAPLVVNWDSKGYRDTIDLSTTEFYQRLRTSQTLPTTGAPSIAVFEQAYRKLLDRFDSVVVVALAAKLSATYDVAVQAAQAVDVERVRVVDSGTISIGIGWLVERACEMGERGAPLEQIVVELEEMRTRIKLLAVLETLEFLQRGGRIGRAQALAGTLLNVKPIIVIQDGEVHPLERVRTMSGATRRLVELVVRQGPLERLGVIHGGAPEGAAELERQLQPHFPRVTIERGELSSVVGTHGGPGVVGAGVLLAR